MLYNIYINAFSYKTLLFKLKFSLKIVTTIIIYVVIYNKKRI